MSAIVWWAITGVAFWHAPGSETECRISRVLEVGFVMVGRTPAGFAVTARPALGRHFGVPSLPDQVGCDGGSAATAARILQLVGALGDVPLREPGAESLE